MAPDQRGEVSDVTTARQAAQEFDPKWFGFAVADRHAQHLSAAVGVDPDCDDDRRRRRCGGPAGLSRRYVNDDNYHNSTPHFSLHFHSFTPYTSSLSITSFSSACPSFLHTMDNFDGVQNWFSSLLFTVSTWDSSS